MRIEVTDYDNVQSLRVAYDAIGCLIAERESDSHLKILTTTPAVAVEQPSIPTTDEPPPVKRTRRTKAEIEAAKAAEKAVEPTPPPVAQATTAFDDPPVATSSFLDEEPAAEPAKVYTRDDARDALVGLQLKRHGQFKAKGQDEGTAARSAEVAAKAVLVAVGGSERLGGVDPSKWGALVEAANKAAAEGI